MVGAHEDPAPCVDGDVVGLDAGRQSRHHPCLGRALAHRHGEHGAAVADTDVAGAIRAERTAEVVAAGVEGAHAGEGEVAQVQGVQAVLLLVELGSDGDVDEVGGHAGVVAGRLDEAGRGGQGGEAMLRVQHPERLVRSAATSRPGCCNVTLRQAHPSSGSGVA